MVNTNLPHLVPHTSVWRLVIQDWLFLDKCGPQHKPTMLSNVIVPGLQDKLAGLTSLKEVTRFYGIFPE